jgi:hypothetical protein
MEFIGVPESLLPGSQPQCRGKHKRAVFQIWNSAGTAGFFCLGHRQADDKGIKLDYE